MEKTDYKGYTITITPDECPEDPRQWDNAGIMACFHPDYNLGDPHNFDGPADLTAHVKSKKFTGVALPLYLYDHSGISMSCELTYPYTDRWDAGQVGYIYISARKIREEWGAGPDATEQARQCLIAEVRTYCQYISGEVYIIEVTGPNNEGIETCGGFYGYDDAMEQARAVVDHDISLPAGQRPKITAAPASALHC